MADAKVVSSGGLSTSSNPLAGGGGYYTLENMISDVGGWATKRNGMKLLAWDLPWTVVFSGITAPVNIISSWGFDDHIFIYVEGVGGTGIAAYSMVTNAGWHKVAESTSTIGIDRSTQKPRSTPSDRRQLIATSSGVKRIAGIYDDYYPRGSTTNVNYSTMYRNAGVPRAIDPRCRNAVAGGATDHGLIALTGFEWLNLSSAVAYRVAWFKRDENGIPAIGAPSGRVVVRNSSTTTNYATRLKIVIPSGVTDSSYVLQIYRTNIIEIDGAGVIPDPGDDMYLSGEYRLTSTDLTNGYVLYEDVSFDTLLGDALYSNENQEGPLAVRFQPPLCRDIATYGGCSFFANTTEKQRLTIKLLAVDSSGIGTFKGVRVGDMIVVGDLVMEGSTLANEEVNAWNFAVDATTGAGSEVIRAIKTAESLCYKYNLRSNATNGRYHAYNMTTNNDIVGVIMLEEKSVGGTTGAYLGVNRVDSPVQLLPAPVFTSTPSNTLALPCAVVTDVGPTTVTVTTSAAHNLTTNDLVFLAPFGTSTESGTSSPRLANTDVPSGVYKVTVTGATTYTFPSPSGAASNQTDARTATTGGYSHKIFDTTSSVWTEARSKNSRQPNRLMWSSFLEPECAPPSNSTDIGGADKAIIRIVPTQDSLFIFKEDGLWRLKGSAGDWEVVVLDASTIIAGCESPAVVDGRVFAYSTNGVVSVDDGGVIKVSGPVSGDLDNLLRSIATGKDNAWKYYGCGHGEAKSYYLYVTGVSQPYVYRYHIPSKTWSKHIFPVSLQNYSVATALTSMTTVKASRYTTFDSQAYAERLLISHSGSNIMQIERRTGQIIDLCDRERPLDVVSFDTSAGTVTCSAVTGVEVGDVFLWYDPANYVPGGYAFSLTVSGRGDTRATITAINGNVLTLEFSGSVTPFASWPAVGAGNSGSALKQIRATAAPLPIVASDGLSLLKFSEVVAAFGSCGRFSVCQFGFNTETATATPGSFQATSTAEGFAYSDWNSFDYNYGDRTLQYIRTCRTGVPRAVSMGSYLIVTLRNSRACENFDIAGIRLIYTEGDSKTRRSNGT